jgi:hypothetical protein
MDPIANLETQRASVAEINEIKDRWPATGDPPAADVARLQELAEQLAEQVEALDAWRTQGGFDPYSPAGSMGGPRADDGPAATSGRENMSPHLMGQLLDSLMYRIPQDVRGKVMHEVPAAYNAWCGRQVVVTHVVPPPGPESTTA